MGATFATPTFVADDLRRRPAQAGSDFISHDVDNGLLLAVGGFPRALFQPTGNEDAGPFVERLGRIFRKFAPRDNVEEADRFLPFVRLAILPATIHGDSEGCCCLAAGGEAQFGVAGHIANNGDVVS